MQGLNGMPGVPWAYCLYTQQSLCAPGSRSSEWAVQCSADALRIKFICSIERMFVDVCNCTRNQSRGLISGAVFSIRRCTESCSSGKVDRMGAVSRSCTLRRD